MNAWHEIIVECPERILRAFVVGYEFGEGHREGLILGCDLDLEKSSLSERVRSLFEAGSHQLIFAQADVADRLARLIQRSGEEAGITLDSVREVTGARFELGAEAYSKEVTAMIRQNLFEDVPGGVELRDLKESEEVDPEARGAELYAPMHDYTYRAGTTVSGPFPAILEMHRRASDLDFVHAGPIHIDARDIG